MHQFSNPYGALPHGIDIDALLSNLPPKPQHILDIGCRYGELTERLSRGAGEVTGIDLSPEAVHKSARLHPKLRILQADATALKLAPIYDVAVSVDVFHHIIDHTRLLQNIYRVLLPNGRLVCEFGAEGNAQKLRYAFHTVASSYDLRFPERFHFQTSSMFHALLIKAGFRSCEIETLSQPTPLPKGREGLREWICWFFQPEMRNIPSNLQDELFIQMENFFASDSWDGNQWIIDYQRIRVIADK